MNTFGDTFTADQGQSRASITDDVLLQSEPPEHQRTQLNLACLNW
jgi:hypothetical protein